LRAVIRGPPDSPFKEGTFYIDIELSHEYPFVPPKVSFATKIFHPNIDGSGNICLDILNEPALWSPAITVQKLVICILSLLTDPNPEDPLCPDVAKLYLRDKKKYFSTAEAWVKLHAR
jgi:ubiquitin-conjugating enzyme E2 D/E